MGKLLVVDDDRDVVELLAYLLERHGHQIIEAEDGREGLDVVVRERPDLIILTAKGQVRDSFERTPNIRYFMEKPFDPKDLQDKVLETLNRS